MRRLILLGLVMALALPALAAHRSTVAQLEEALAASEAANHADAEVAHQVGELELSERLTDSDLNRFAAKFKLGPRTALALQLLADQSAFFDPPPSELPATALPDDETQKRMVAAAQAYALQSWSRMPNFFVTRVTNRFDDGPHVLEKGGWPVSAGLQPVGTVSREVSFRDGKEVLEATAQPTSATAKGAEELGLHSWGEFGPAVTVVLADVARQKVAFSHWEQTASGLAAVFRYAVPREVSHYAVAYCCVLNEQVIGRTQFGYAGRDRSAQQVANIPREKALLTYTEQPGYHGTISIDPATGAVMRLTIQADLSNGDPLLRAETMVQYGPVTIGDRQFICPVRSLAISMESASGLGSGHSATPNGVGNDGAWQTAVSRPSKQTVLLINETNFVSYHRLGSSIRILTDADGSGRSNKDATITAAQNSLPANSATARVEDNSTAQAVPNSAPDSAQPTVQTASSVPPPLSGEVPASPSPPVEPVILEISMSAANNVPDQPANPPLASDNSFSLKVTSRLVDVGLVAHDKKGNPVTDLIVSDLEIYDNGRKQDIRSFGLMNGTTQIVQQPKPDQTDTQEPGPTFTNRAPDSIKSASPSSSSEAGATVLLIDESHIAWTDMSYARGQILKFLSSLPAGERVGLYRMNGLGFHVLAEITSDHATLIARMQKYLPSAQSASAAQEEETRNRQHFDEVHNAADLNSVNGNHTDVPDAIAPIDPQLMTMGDDPVRSSFIILTQVARHLSAIPGPKKLVWVSSDNVFADWQDQSVGIEKSPKPVQAYAIRAQESMNDAHAAVYPFDVSQLEGGAISADLQHQNVQLTQAAAENATLGGGVATSRSTGPGRIDAAMSQDIHPVQGPVRDVAAATGGRVIRRAGDLAGQLNGILADEHATYMLSFSPQGPADGQYHTISVKVNGRRGLNLSYRTGYLFDREAESLHDRFQQAVWRPTDVSDIAVTANISPGDGGATVDVNIAAGDLGLEQRATRWMDRLDIFFIQRDDAGLHAQLEGETLGLRLKSATYQRLLPSGVPFQRFVALKSGTGSVRVLVVDENSGHMGSVTIPASAMRAAK